MASYVTRQEFKNSPSHSIDVKYLVPGGTQQDQDTALDTVLEMASRMVESYVGYVLFNSTKTETYSARVTRNLTLVVHPKANNISAVSLIEIRNPRLTLTYTVVPSDNFTFDSKSVKVYRMFSKHDNDTHDVRITYTSGFVTIPEDVKAATILYAAAFIKENGTTSITMNGVPSTLGGSPFDNSLYTKFKQMLEPYRKVV